MIEFDPKKAAANLKKHGVAFTDVESVLYDPSQLTLGDDAEGEARWVTLGQDDQGRLRVVVWTERGDNVRIISARPATAEERQAYEG